MVGKAQKLHWARSELNSVFDLEKVAFPTMKRELQGKKFRSDQWSAACFQEVGGKL
jgi:hypothetical protein